MNKELLIELRDFIKSVYDFRANRDIEEDSLIFNTCDYHNMESLIDELNKEVKKSDVSKEDKG